jgi:hypothetical protein
MEVDDSNGAVDAMETEQNVEAPVYLSTFTAEPTRHHSYKLRHRVPTVDIIITTHGQMSDQVTAYKLRDMDHPSRLESRPLNVSELAPKCTLNVIMFNETGKCSMVARKFRECMEIAQAMYEHKGTLFHSDMVDKLNILNNSVKDGVYKDLKYTLGYYFDLVSGKETRYSGSFEGFPALTNIPEKKYSAENSGGEPNFSVFTPDPKLHEFITMSINSLGERDKLSLMRIILTIDGWMDRFYKGQPYIINLVDVSCNALKDRLNAKIVRGDDGSIEYLKPGKGITKRKGSKRTKRRRTKRRKTKRRN